MSLFDIPIHRADGSETTLRAIPGRAYLIVNVASRCGFTEQYDGLQALHEKYGARGLSIVAFPCNQFMGQEPGTDTEIQAFCQSIYGVKFPVMAKIDVNGAEAHPLFAQLRKAAPGFLWTSAIKWNFTKFLVTDEGRRTERFATQTKPVALERKIETALGLSPP